MPEGALPRRRLTPEPRLPRPPGGPRSDRRPAAVNDPLSTQRNHQNMRRALLMLLAVTVLAGLSGCVQNQVCQPCGQGMTCMMPGSCAYAPATCQACSPSGPCNAYAGGVGCGPYDPCSDPEALGMFNPGPPTGAVTYPYYTVRGPRDFLAREPRPIGP